MRASVIVSSILASVIVASADEIKTKTLGEIGYEIAAKYLHEISERRELSLHHALQAEECEMRLDRGRVDEAARKTREMIRRFHPRAMEKIKEILKNYGERKTNERVLILILYHRQYELYREHGHEPIDKLSWIQDLVENVRQISYEIAGETDVTSKNVAIKYGAIFVQRALNNIRDLSNVDEERKALIIAECHFTLGNIYFRAGHYENSAQSMNEAIKFVGIDDPIANMVVPTSPEQHQASNLMRRPINLNLIKTFDGFGQEIEAIVETKCLMLWILGNCHYRMENFVAARQYYKKTLEKLRDHGGVAERWAKIVGKDLLKAVYRVGRGKLIHIYHKL